MNTPEIINTFLNHSNNLICFRNKNQPENEPEKETITIVKPTTRKRTPKAKQNELPDGVRSINFIPQDFEIVPKSTIMETYKKWDKNNYNDNNRNDPKRNQKKKVPKKYHRINLIQNNNRVHFENGNLEIIDDKGHVHHRQNYNVFMKYIDDMDNSIKSEQEYYKSLKFIQSQQENNGDKNDDNISTDQTEDTINTRLTVKPFRTFLSTSEIYDKCQLVIPNTEYGNLMKYNAKINELLLLSHDELIKYEYGNEINNIMFGNSSETYENNGNDEISDSVDNVGPDGTLETVKQVDNTPEPPKMVDSVQRDITDETLEQIQNTVEKIEPVIETKAIEPVMVTDPIEPVIATETIEPVNATEVIEPVNATEAVERPTTSQTVALVPNPAGNIESACSSRTIRNTEKIGTVNKQSVNVISNNNLISNTANKINRNKKKREPDDNLQNNVIKRSRYNTDNINILDTIRIAHFERDICIVSLPMPVYLSQFALVDWLNVSPMVLICNHSSNNDNTVNTRNCIIKFCSDDKLNFIEMDCLGVYRGMNHRKVFALPEEYDALKVIKIYYIYFISLYFYIEIFFIFNLSINIIIK